MKGSLYSLFLKFRISCTVLDISEMASKEKSNSNLAPYLRQAHATFRNGFEDPELKKIFLRNTFEEITGSTVHFCTDKSLSFCLEEMIKELDFDTTLKFLDSISKSWMDISFNPSGSHVMQTLSKKISLLMHQSKDISDENAKILEHFAAIVSSDIKNFCQLMKDPNGSHVFRSLFRMIGGVGIDESQKVATSSNFIVCKEKLPKVFTKTLKMTCENLKEMKQRDIAEYLTDAHSGSCLSCVIEVLSKRHLMKTLRLFCETFTSTFSEDSIVIMMKDKQASHFFEELLLYGSKSVKKVLKTVLFSDEKRFFELCVHPIANFVIQRLISSADNAESFQEIFDFVNQGFEDILAGQSYGLIQKLCEQCVTFSEFQRTFYDKLLEAFHCTDIESRASLVLLLATLRTHDSLFQNDPNHVIKEVEYHGSVLLQTLLKFGNIGLLVKSMNSISVENIVVLSGDISGSHFIDEFFSSGKLKFKIKKDIVEKIGEDWFKISCNKYGSRVVEKLWDSSDIVIKRVIVKSLIKNGDALSENEFGKFVHRKTQIKRYQTRQEEWETIQKQICKKRKMFADIMPKSKVAKKSKS